MNKRQKYVETRQISLPKSRNVKAISLEELQASGHFKDWSEEEIKMLVETVRAFTEIVYAAWAKQTPAAQSPLIIVLSREHQKVA